MALTWALLGLTVGTDQGLSQGGLAAVLAHQVAGVVVFLPLGAFLGLFSGHAKYSLLGGACGALAGLLSLAIGNPGSVAGTFRLYLVMGALFGATVSLPIKGVASVLQGLSRLSRIAR